VHRPCFKRTAHIRAARTTHTEQPIVIGFSYRLLVTLPIGFPETRHRLEIAHDLLSSTTPDRRCRADIWLFATNTIVGRVRLNSRPTEAATRTWPPLS
jgi:hypothetical protein